MGGAAHRWMILVKGTIRVIILTMKICGVVGWEKRTQWTNQAGQRCAACWWIARQRWYCCICYVVYVNLIIVVINAAMLEIPYCYLHYRRREKPKPTIEKITYPSNADTVQTTVSTTICSIRVMGGAAHRWMILLIRISRQTMRIAIFWFLLPFNDKKKLIVCGLSVIFLLKF